MTDFMNGEPIDPGSCELHLLGSAPDLPLANLNLAGAGGFPDPSLLSHPSQSMDIRTPDYLVPDMSPTALRFGDLAAAAIDARPEFAPDPSQPDLTAPPQPYAMDMFTNDLMPVDPLLAQDVPSDADIAATMYPGLGFAGLQVSDDYHDPDPPLLDLQDPDLTQDVVMAPEDRPGEMDDSAMDVLHAEPDYRDVADKSYPAVFMDQRGDNARRARQNTLRLQGLDVAAYDDDDNSIESDNPLEDDD